MPAQNVPCNPPTPRTRLFWLSATPFSGDTGCARMWWDRGGVCVGCVCARVCVCPLLISSYVSSVLQCARVCSSACVCGGARSRTQCNTILKHTICIHTQKLTYKKNILKKKGIDADTCSSCNALLGREECEGEECEGEECEGDRCARAARISASLSCLAFRL